MMIEMRNFPGPKKEISPGKCGSGGVVVNQSLSGRLLVMEPDYLPIPEIFISAMIVPQLDFTIRGYGGSGG